MQKGVLHIHSTYSDGEFTLAEVREMLLAAGCSFACISDHAEAFDASKRDAYLAELARLSDRHFLFVPGLEYECAGRMHVLGYGSTALVDTQDPQEVFECIARAGGIAVIAHPADAMFETIRRFTRLPAGMETWNSKYDGQYAPRPRTFQLLEQLQQRRPELRAFYGVDLHWRQQYRGLYTRVACPALTPEALLAALRAGDYVGIKDELELPSHGRLPAAVLARFHVAHERSARLRRWMKSAKKLADRIGLRMPAGVKARLRRIF